MPYIPSDIIRSELDSVSNDLIKILSKEGITGNLNYFIFRTIKHLCRKYKHYAHFEGDIQKSLRESYRRIETPYENKKIKENGDVK